MSLVPGAGITAVTTGDIVSTVNGDQVEVLGFDLPEGWSPASDHFDLLKRAEGYQNELKLQHIATRQMCEKMKLIGLIRSEHDGGRDEIVRLEPVEVRPLTAEKRFALYPKLRKMLQDSDELIGSTALLPSVFLRKYSKLMPFESALMQVSVLSIVNTQMQLVGDASYLERLLASWRAGSGAEGDERAAATQLIQYLLHDIGKKDKSDAYAAMPIEWLEARIASIRELLVVTEQGTSRH